MPEIQYYKDEWEVSDALQAFYTPYASYVIQTRALPDARDGLITGARFILYSQYKDKLTIKNKRRKAVATINAAMRFSPHGDSSILGTAVRLSQDFSMRYPVIEVQGNNGSYLSGDDFAQARYLEMRGNEIAYDMTYLLDKNTVDKWKMNYTNEEEYPAYLPSKFPFALVNGSFGIGVACSSSVPPHNIKDVCSAIISLINNPDSSFEELYCPIDFPTGGTIINENDVKESLKNGCGKAALVRASIEYDEKQNELIVYEMPYMTFTTKAIKSIEKAIDEGLLSGIESVTDSTEEKPKICIQLAKNVNVQKIVRLLYKHTLLQSDYSINMNMLEEGLRPRRYTWKEQLETYIKQLKNIITKSYQFDLNELLSRIHILDGFIIAFHNIEQLLKDIRDSKNNGEAKEKIINSYSLDNSQADALLKMRLSNLTHLEVEKLLNEKDEKQANADMILEILRSDEKIKEQMIIDIQKIADKYGDERRTKSINLDFTSEGDDAEPIEKVELLIHYTNQGNIYTQEATTLLTTHRGGKGTKVKLGKNETIIRTLNDNNLNSLLIFSNKGKMYSIFTSDLPINAKVNLSQLFNFDNDEYPTALTTKARKADKNYFVFITKNGLIKKTKASEYEKGRGKSIKAINLNDSDEVIDVHSITDELVGILTSDGNCVIIDTNEINAIGRTTFGVKAVKLNKDNYVISSKIISDKDKFFITISQKGLIKKSNILDFPVCSRGIKGKKISGTKDNDNIVDFLSLKEDTDIVIGTENNIIKFNTTELRTLSREAIGVKAISLLEFDKVIKLIKS